MFNLRPIFRSLRFRIVLLNFLALTVTMFAFSVILYAKYNETLYRKFDTLLRTRYDGVEEAIRTYWKAKKRDDGFGRFAGSLTAGTLSPNRDSFSPAITIFDPKGAVLATSNSLPEMDTLSPAELANLLDSQRSLKNHVLERKGRSPVNVRVLTAPLSDDREVRCIIRIAGSLDELENDMIQYRRTVFMIAPWIIALASLAALLLVKSTLSPMNRMVEAIGRIRTENFREGIQVPDTDEDVMRLARTFNRLLEEIDKAFTSQRQIIQDISHELKTPLTVLKGELEITLKQTRKPADYKAVLKSALEEVDTIRRIIDNLLILARFDSAGFQMTLAPLNLDFLMQSVLEDLRVLAESKKIQILFDPGPGILLNGNEAFLRRLFSNLVENAVKFTPAEGRVSIKVRQEGRAAVAEIHDSGPGIPENEIGNVFDRFYRGDKARKSGSGFGLGLCIAKSITEAHKGSIAVKSSPKAGTLFTVTLPIQS